MRDIENHFIKNTNNNLWVMVNEKDKVIATIGCELLTQDITILELKANSVHHEYRRRGYATKLCEKVFEHGKNIGCKKVILTTSTSVGHSFYEKIGFKHEKTTFIGYRPLYHFEKLL